MFGKSDLNIRHDLSKLHDETALMSEKSLLTNNPTADAKSPTNLQKFKNQCLGNDKKSDKESSPIKSAARILEEKLADICGVVEVKLQMKIKEALIKVDES